MRFQTLAVMLVCSAGIAAGTISLGTVRRVYVERMPNHLDQYVRTEMYKQFKDRLAVVLDRREADGILVIPTGNQSTPRPPAASVPPGPRIESDLMISLLDKSGTVILWSDDFGNRDAISSNAGAHAMAKRIIHKLRRAMERSR
jgi:hypothetical protein